MDQLKLNVGNESSQGPSPQVPSSFLPRPVQRPPTSPSPLRLPPLAGASSPRLPLNNFKLKAPFLSTRSQLHSRKRVRTQKQEGSPWPKGELENLVAPKKMKTEKAEGEPKLMSFYKGGGVFGSKRKVLQVISSQ